MFVFFIRIILKKTNGTVKMEMVVHETPLYNDGRPTAFFRDYIFNTVLATNQRWEENICREIAKNIRNDTDFLDIGANIGLVTLGVAELLKENQHKEYFPPKQVRTFHCVECSIRNINLLKYNTKHLENVQIYPFALSDTFHMANMSENATNTGCDHISLRVEPGKNTNITYDNYTEFSQQNVKTWVPCLTLDMIRHLFTNRVSVVKLDVEGFEYFVLAGGAEWFKEHQPVLIVEIFEQNRSRVFDLLAEYGYDSARRIGNEDYLFTIGGTIGSP